MVQDRIRYHIRNSDTHSNLDHDRFHSNIGPETDKINEEKGIMRLYVRKNDMCRMAQLIFDIITFMELPWNVVDELLSLLMH